MIKVNYRALGMLSTNCYVVENPDSQKVLIVDPGDSPLEIERQIDEIDGDPGGHSADPWPFRPYAGSGCTAEKVPYPGLCP